MSIPFLTLLAWLVWLIFYWKGGAKILLDIRAATHARDRVLLIALGVMTAALVIAAFSSYLRADDNTTHELMTANGFMFVVLGIGGTFYARWTSSLQTPRIARHKDRGVVSDGLYAIIRHPINVAAILLYAGTALVFFSPFTVALTWAVIAAYVIKTRREDRLLHAHQPGYEQYARRVPFRLIPLVW